MVKNSNGLEVVRMHRLQGDSKLKAFADVSFAGVFMVKGLRVTEGRNGLFVSMPSEQGKNGKWYDKARPLTKEFKGLLSDVVLESYRSE